MARPLKLGMDYFPHDVGAADDEKIDAMRAIHGNDGYAFYFILLERIYRTDNGCLDISNRFLKAAVARKVGVDQNKFESMLSDAAEIGLFDKESFQNSGIITSHGIRKRVDEINRQREKWRNKRIISRDNSGDNPSNPEDNMERTPESKAKKIKVNTSMSEAPASDSPTAIELILNDKTLFPISQTKVKEWSGLYPAVDIMQELRKMKGWLDTNPAKRKTKRGILRFVNNWLAREQDKGPRQANQDKKELPLLR